MRLVKAEFSGFGRLAEGTVNLDNKVIAIVGPNEAGKTTLLRALAYIDSKESLPVYKRSRGMTVADNHSVVRVQYILDEEDRASVADLSLQEQPRALWVARRAGGGAATVKIEPPPEKTIAPLESLLKSLFRSASKRALKALAYVDPDNIDTDNPGPRATFGTRVVDLIDRLRNAVQDMALDAAVTQQSTDIAAIVEEFEQYGLDGGIKDALASVNDWILAPNPEPEARSRLYNRTPDILLFEDADRTLASSYTLSAEVVNEPPIALANLSSMAELSLDALWNSITNDDQGERETIIEEANQTLATKFARSWKQSNVAVHLKIEGLELAVRIKQDGKRITQFDERSAGLRMFVALFAFLAVRGSIRPPILLIDEAETHLHIDAQADLVNTFMSQQQAAKIIYTTHSPACLPPDLGSNIRAVLPDATQEGRSLIKGSFWHKSAGFSPLLLAMGAGAAAFSAARFVVLAEGASEMLLLPSLIKAAIGLDDLPYQVAPGISETPVSMYSELDLEGTRVAYLVDGDSGGIELQRRLIQHGVHPSQVLLLGALTLENLVDSDSYLKAVRLLVEESNPGLTVPKLPKLPDATKVAWPKFLSEWTLTRSLVMPGKRVVASRLVEEGLAKPSMMGAQSLRTLHESLEGIFNKRLQ